MGTETRAAPSHAHRNGDSKLADVPPSLDEYRAVAIKAGLLLCSFRNKNRTEGYPLREPPGVTDAIASLDNLIERDSASGVA